MRLRRAIARALASLLCSGAAWSQGRPTDWSFYGGDAQRTGWTKSDIRITKENVKDFQLVLKRKLETKQKGPRSLAPPVVIGNLISYRGFKELAFVAGTGDNIWSIDADMDRMFWQKHLESAPEKGKHSGQAAYCAGSIVAMPSLTPPPAFGARPRPAAGPTASPGAPPSPAATPAPAGTAVTPAPRRNLLGSTGFGSPRPAFALASDGKLHVLNTSTGEESVPALRFLSPGAIASSLTISENTLYTTTSGSCGGTPNGVWAIDLTNTDEHREVPVANFALPGTEIPGLGGMAIGADGTVYVQTGEATGEASAQKWADTLLALTSKELKLKGSFALSTANASARSEGALNHATPVIFPHKDGELLVATGKDGRLYLFDTKSLTGKGQATPLSQTPPLAKEGGVWGGLSSWEDPDGVRWVLAPVWGALNPELKVASGSAASNGSIVAFKVEERDGKPTLTPAWASRDMQSPEPPVITNGVVFALSAGDYGRGERPKSGTHATLYALDAATGQEMYSTANQVATPGNLTGLTLANGRVFFTTNDGMLYGFGIFLER